MLKKNFMPKLERKKLDKSLHWTTFYSEKLLLAVIGALTMFAAGMDVLEMVKSLLDDSDCLAYTNPLI